MNADETFIAENYKHQGGPLHKSLCTKMYNTSIRAALRYKNFKSAAPTQFLRYNQIKTKTLLTPAYYKV